MSHSPLAKENGERLKNSTYSDPSKAPAKCAGTDCSDSDPDGADMGNWTIQLLHQTAREFLNESNNLQFVLQAQGSRIDSIARNPACTLESVLQGITQWPSKPRPTGDGHSYILQACENWLNTHPNSRTRAITNTTKIIGDVLYHAPRAEREPQNHLTELLDDIDAHLSRRFSRFSPETWFTASFNEHQRHSRFGSFLMSFLSFAISANMCWYVEERLRSEPDIVKQPAGLQLLQFSLTPPLVGDGPLLRPRMTKILLDNGVSMTGKDLKGRTWDSLSSLVTACLLCHDTLDARDIIYMMELLLQRGADPNVQIDGCWDRNEDDEEARHPIIHAVIQLPIHRRRTMEILKLLINNGADVDVLNGYGGSFVEALFFLDFIKLSVEDWLWLLMHGVKISRDMVELRIGIYAARNKEHPLRDPECRKPQFYDGRARPAAFTYNPSWHSGSVISQATLQRAILNSRILYRNATFSFIRHQKKAARLWEAFCDDPI